MTLIVGDYYMIRKLTAERIEIWQADLNECTFLKFYRYFYILSKEEKENASSFKIDVHRKSYILSHMILRILLSQYTGIDPQLLEIHKSKHGKPFIKSSNLKFNISHSKEKLAIAIATCEVGIDIEYINPSFDIDEILDITLSINEKLYIKKLESILQKQQFYLYWTQKEALLKAIGTGINVNLSTFEILNGYNMNIYKGKKWVIAPCSNFKTDYIAHVAYKHEKYKIIKFYTFN